MVASNSNKWGGCRAVGLSFRRALDRQRATTDENQAYGMSIGRIKAIFPEIKGHAVT